MRTPRSGAGKRTPPAKKDAASANAVASVENTPELPAAAAAPKSTPKSGAGTRAAKGTAKRSSTKATAAAASATATPVAAPTTPSAEASTPVAALATPDPAVSATSAGAAATLDPKPKEKVEETTTPSHDPKSTPSAKSPEKKLAAKTNSPSLSHTEAAAAKSLTVELDVKTETSPMIEESEIPHPTVVGGEQERLNKEAKCVPSSEEREREVHSAADKGVATVDDMKKEVGESMEDYGVESVIEESAIKKEEESGEQVAVEGENAMVYVGHKGSDEPGDEEVLGEEREDEEAVKEDVEEEAGGLKEDEQVEMLDMIKERKKKKEQEIFVGGLDRDATEEDVKKAFEKIGVVEDVRLHKDFTTNKNKGFAFVKFADKEQARRAISELKNPIIHGKRCGIAPSEDNDTLFLGNICNTWTKEAIKRRLKDYGVEEVENITLVGDTQNEGLSRGFAFLEFSCHEYAMNAYKRLQKPDVVFGHAEWSAKVAFAEPLREPDPEVMAQVKSVFVDGMPPYWDEDRVKEQFKEYGEIEGVVLARNMPTAKRRDFGFVNYTSHEAAVACVEAVNNTELGDGKSKMKVRARLANPLPKTQAVKGGMRGGFRIGHAGIGGFSKFAGRGFGRGRLPFVRGGFQGARGFHFRGRGRGRGGRFPFLADNGMEGSHFRSRGRQPFGVRGGRGFFRGAYEGVSDEFSPRFGPGRSGHGGFIGGHRPFNPRREPFGFDGDFGGSFDSGHFAEDPYYYGDMGRGPHGIKRPFSMLEHDSRYLETGSRVRPRYDLADQFSSGTRYRDPMGSAGDMYAYDYPGSEYGASEYSSLYGSERSGSGYYY